MDYPLPPEIADLDAAISELRRKRDVLHAQWLDSIAPFKRGERVVTTRGRIKRVGVVVWQKPSFMGQWEYGVDVELKKGGSKQVRVYSWEPPLEAAPPPPP